MSHESPHDLLSANPAARRGALASLEPELAGHALRDVLLFDDQAPLRALAARRLGRTGDPSWAPWVAEALSDPAPMVREAACEASARLAGDGSRVREVALRDGHWRVRRIAVHALLAIMGAEAREPLRAVLSDPFWRVRRAALDALGRIGVAAPELRAEILAPLETSEAQAALTYLGAQWDVWEGALELDLSDPPKEAPLTPWDDGDPAVVTANLIEAEPETLATDALCALLSNPHEALRNQVVSLLAERPAQELGAALEWLERPGPPRAREGAERLLRALGDRARPLVELALAAPERDGRIWALRWAGARRDESLWGPVQAVAGDPRWEVRRALCEVAVEAGASSEEGFPQILAAALLDPEARVREVAIRGLPRRRAEQEPQRSREILDLAFAAQTPPARAALLVAASRSEEWLYLAREGLGDHHPAVRARAVDLLSEAEQLSSEQLARALEDPDPWVQAVALQHSASTSLEAGLGAAAAPLSKRAQARGLVAGRAALAPSQALAAAELLSRAGDPWVRARAARLLDPPAQGPRATACALLLSQDRAPAVRASVREVLEAPAALAHSEAFLEELGASPELSRAAWSLWACAASADPNAHAEARARLETRLAAPCSERLREHLEALGLLFLEVEDLPRPPARPRRSPRPVVTPRQVPLRALGETGLEVSSLVVSGAHDLSFEAYEQAAQAGVNVFFWEPGYGNLTRFLKSKRGQGCQVVTGTFHAHEEGVRADLARARSRLGRATLEVFLYFWARSEARLSPERFALMQSLKASGRIRAHGFSTHERDLAVAALRRDPWDVVMVRHNAAHVGAEGSVFPEAAARRVGVLTFSATCYGRLLQRAPSAPEAVPPTAPECYRYSLAQPGVSATLSAPRRYRELIDNLSVLEEASLSGEDQARLREHGRSVYHANKDFNRLVRRPPLGTTLRAHALAQIEGLVPRPEVPSPLPRASMLSAELRRG